MRVEWYQLRCMQQESINKRRKRRETCPGMHPFVCTLMDFCSRSGFRCVDRGDGERKKEGRIVATSSIPEGNRKGTIRCLHLGKDQEKIRKRSGQQPVCVCVCV